jgi:hypothetical protein
VLAEGQVWWCVETDLTAGVGVLGLFPREKGSDFLIESWDLLAVLH